MPPKKSISTQLPSSPDFKSLSQVEVENLLSDLYEKFDNVRNFIDLRMTGNSDSLVKKYKKLIKNRLIEDIEEGTDGLYEALQAVSDFSDYGTSPLDQADIMLHFVESALYCHNQYGDLYEEFYEEAVEMFLGTLEFIKNHQLLKEFRNRCKKVIDNSKTMGYGFQDTLEVIYYTFYPERETKTRKLLKKPVPIKPAIKPKPFKPGKK